jgi:hypothetical protein
LLDTAVVLLRRADDTQLAGSAEVMAEDMRDFIRDVEAFEKRRKEGDQ